MIGGVRPMPGVIIPANPCQATPDPSSSGLSPQGDSHRIGDDALDPIHVLQSRPASYGGKDDPIHPDVQTFCVKSDDVRTIIPASDHTLTTGPCGLLSSAGRRKPSAENRLGIFQETPAAVHATCNAVATATNVSSGNAAGSPPTGKSAYHPTGPPGGNRAAVAECRWTFRIRRRHRAGLRS